MDGRVFLATVICLTRSFLDSFIGGVVVSLSLRLTSSSIRCAGDAIYLVLQEVGLGDSEIRGADAQYYAVICSSIFLLLYVVSEATRSSLRCKLQNYFFHREHGHAPDHWFECVYTTHHSDEKSCANMYIPLVDRYQHISHSHNHHPPSLVDNQ